MLVGRFIGLDAEQRAADRRLIEACEGVEAARIERNELTAELEAWEAEGVLTRRVVAQLMVERRGEVSAADILALPEVHTELDAAALAPYAAEAGRAVTEAFDRCEAKLPETEKTLPGWDPVRAALHLPYDRWDRLRKRVFQQVVKNKRRAAAQARQVAERAERAKSAGPLSAVMANLVVPFPPSTVGSSLAEDLNVDFEPIPVAPVGLRNRLADVEIRLRTDQLELTQAERAAQGAKAPPGLLLAVGVLTVLTLVGLVWPVCALYLEPAYAGSSHRLGVLLAFIAGLTLLLVYLWAYALRLSRRREVAFSAERGRP